MFNRLERLAFFSSRAATPAHIITLVLIIGAMGVTAYRVLTKDGPTARSDTMALAMGAKSIIIVAYQLLSAHTHRFARWYSLKANMILNGLEIVFWGAVAFLTMQGMTGKNKCKGTSCTLGWIVIVLAALVSQMEVYGFVIALLDWRYFKREGKRRDQARMMRMEDSDQVRMVRMEEGSFDRDVEQVHHGHHGRHDPHERHGHHGHRTRK
ncbi:hypothetical protein K458DRAFT_434343 [Lentithecium fluviatile CBS 122367]|uniref:MARVEL domain-containing protein n=1 Tax=Lentithecium fluviatile CBS 122367 TaxID=1168545 RepID=A0A6G1IRD9_9PLEO|nr:hypothetical protein K458DRAFT_434343 [Lentithecium fluviatile CBS 122367]